MILVKQGHLWYAYDCRPDEVGLYDPLAWDVYPDKAYQKMIVILSTGSIDVPWHVYDGHVEEADEDSAGW